MHFETAPSEVDPQRPLIYVWSIYSPANELLGRYVGKAKGGEHRPLTHYARNVARLLAGQPYRKNKPDAFRKVHRALAAAHAAGHRIVLSYACNVPDGERIDSVEQHWIRHHDTRGTAPWQLNG